MLLCPMQAVTLYGYFKWHSKHTNISQYKSTHVSTSSEASGVTDARLRLQETLMCGQTSNLQRQAWQAALNWVEFFQTTDT
jgi:hypothetical protein